jgi:hypothetical protein
MLSQSPLPIEPFKRLHVNDGLLLTAERWQVAHDYHRKRQNVHYQSLNQAGIVSGLGVCLIAAPDDLAPEHRDGRWLQIQQGVAIDGYGNPIVVPQAIAFRIASPAPITDFLTIYIVLRYVDPDRLQGLGDRDLVQETFRIDETSTPPTHDEVELCRVRLQPGEVKLIPAVDVLNPIANSLDLRGRQLAQARPVQQVRLAQVVSKADSVDANTAYRLQSLLQSLAALYPTMQGAPIPPIPLFDPETPLVSVDLLHMTQQQFFSLTEVEKVTLQRYITAGTVIFVEMEEAEIAELSLIQQQLKGAIASFNPEIDSAQVKIDLETEQAAIAAALTKQLESMTSTIQDIIPQIDLSTESFGTVGREHSLRLAPFLFAQFPSTNGHSVQLFNWGGLILSIGSLSQAWGLDDALSLSRETIRSAQELGINILHFAWRRRQLTQLQQPPE